MYIQILNSFAVVNVVDISNSKMVLYATLTDVLMIDWVLSVFLIHIFPVTHHCVNGDYTSHCKKADFDFYKTETADIFKHSES